MNKLYGDFFPDNRNVILTNYGRTAFEKILQLRELSGGTVAFPGLLANDVFEHLIDEYDLDPVFVDVTPQSYHMDVEHVKQTLEAVDAVVLNHTFGVPANVREWRPVASRRDITLIEDCARGFGGFVAGQPVGSVGDFAIYSLKKVTPAVRGGALVGTFDPARIDFESPVYNIKNAYPLLPDPIESKVVRLYRRRIKPNWSMNGDESNARFHPIAPVARELDGINTAVFLYHLLRGFSQQLRQNATSARRIRRSLSETGVEFQATRGACPFHFLGMTVPGHREEIVDRLRDIGVAPRTFWKSPLLSSFVGERRFSEYPNTMAVVENGIQLPLVEMDEKTVSRAIEVIRQTIESRRRTTARFHSR